MARRDDYFCPGIIKAAYKDNSIAVDFESEETPLIYSNVLSRGDFDTIISDAVPATNQVNVIQGIMKLSPVLLLTVFSKSESQP